MRRRLFKRGGPYTTTRETSERMSRVRQRGTGPELATRRALSALGLRYRLNNRDLPGSPDMANRRHRWAVQVAGCYWHRHKGCSRATTPKTNRDFWLRKFAANVARDKRTARALRRLGFRVVVVWECQTERADALRGRLRRFVVDRGTPESRLGVG